MKRAANAFLIGATARMIHEDSPHHLSGNGKELGAVLPISSLLGCEPQVCFMDQGAGLKRMFRALVTHIAVSQPAELYIDDRKKLTGSFCIAFTPRPQQQGDVLA